MLAEIPYVPLLHTRLAELNAINELPESTKARMLPLFVARPWLNAQSLDRLWERMDISFGGRQFALDLDSTRYRPGSDNPAYQSFNALFNPMDGHVAYFNKVAELEFAVPTLRSVGDNFDQLEAQFDQIDALGRGVIVRAQYLHRTNIGPVIQRLETHGLENLVFYLDGGWNRDLLGREAWLTLIVQRIVQFDPNAEIVVSASSFPNSFVQNGLRLSYNINERALFDRIRVNTNANLFYGDWGSTRPPTDPVPMRNVPRIDLSQSREWIAFRQDDEVVGYTELAEEVISDIAWPDALDVWGTYIIRSTAEGLPNAIKGPAAAAAARVNLHIHQQAHFADPVGILDTEDEFADIV